ncbi:MAG: hypothetical protein AAGK05_19800, partial [Pseudomonadota bacterium]
NPHIYPPVYFIHGIAKWSHTAGGVAKHLWIAPEVSASTASIERSFSMLKKLLAKDRNFKPHNVKQFIILYCNSK